jgi:hypothetical protein
MAICPGMSMDVSGLTVQAVTASAAMSNKFLVLMTANRSNRHTLRLRSRRMPGWSIECPHPTGTPPRTQAPYMTPPQILSSYRFFCPSTFVDLCKYTQLRENFRRGEFCKRKQKKELSLQRLINKAI